jgi:hypothetical protein
MSTFYEGNRFSFDSKLDIIVNELIPISRITKTLKEDSP